MAGMDNMEWLVQGAIWHWLIIPVVTGGAVMIRAFKERYPVCCRSLLLAGGIGLSVSLIMVLLLQGLLVDKIEQTTEPSARRPYFSLAGSTLSGAVGQQRILSCVSAKQ